MNISYKWLKKYIDTDLTPDEVSVALTSLGLEVGSLERVETIRGGLRGLVVGHVLTCIDHPNSDHLHITTVDLGDGNDPVQIVCGAANVAAGQKVIVATLGTKLYDGDQEFTIKRSKMRGEESLGMICAEDEIGVGSSHEGIIVLPDDTHTGMPAAEYYKVEDDWLIEVDLTPNRIDGASHYGVARDLSAWCKQNGRKGTLLKPSVGVFKIDRQDGGIPVEVKNEEACPRYSGLTIRGVKVQESPKWLKDLLLAVGQRPINNIVDITNYILLGIGQPMHCFDLAKVKGDMVVVRTVESGTKFVTLDGEERTLTDRDLMICNAEQPMCIGGVFGGLDSGVTEQTTDIFLESAYFHPTWIRKTARRFGLNTDASFRFERGIDPNETVRNLMLAALMVQELAGGDICGDIVDVKAHEFPGFPVDLEYSYVDALIGKQIPHETIKNILRSLEIKIVNEEVDRLQLTVPTYRVDVQRPCDVVEDILRVYGYNNVEIHDDVRSSLSSKTMVDFADDMQEHISNQLTAVGFNEIMNNSLTPASYYTDLKAYPEANCVHIMNPLSSDLNVKRQTLLFGGLESVARNINHKNQNLRLYEFGTTYHYEPGEDQTEKVLAPYTEGKYLGMWISGNNHTDAWADKVRPVTVYDLKATLENVLMGMGIDLNSLVLEQTADDTIDPALAYKTHDGHPVAILGVVTDELLKRTDIDQAVFYASIDWKRACKIAAKKDIKYHDLPKTLPVRRDLALLVDRAVTYEDIRRVVMASDRKLLREVNLFDVYESNKLAAGKKSYAISMTLQDDQKTLQDKQIDAVMQKVIKNLETQLGAQLR
ncbi:MAG: phenylalanine--tRNA ligase subunit beta [Muribaculaceae bacterium]|nr:phenylalanine--tRNA ligase subunit beta [Muribaculaceae bacterium]